jgi:hypothetical protein
VFFSLLFFLSPLGLFAFSSIISLLPSFLLAPALEVVEYSMHYT